jgi:Fe-S cluster biogenesis protein NfuA
MNRQEVEQVLEQDVRPFLRRDGGDIQLVDIRENRVYVRLTGACQGCPSAALTLRLAVERALRAEFPEMEELVTV